MQYVTQDELAMMRRLEDIMGAIHCVSSSYDLLNNPRQPSDFKGRVRAELPEHWSRMMDVLADAQSLTMPGEPK